MGMTKSEILAEWEGTHGELTPRWREAFLEDPRVERLCQIDSNSVRKAIGSNHKLDAILRTARAYRSQIVKSSSRRGEVKDQSRSRSRYSYGHYPHRPTDAELHKRIGPTQQYSDDA